MEIQKDGSFINWKRWSKPARFLLLAILFVLWLMFSNLLTRRNLLRAQSLTVTPFVLKMDVYYFKDDPNGEFVWGTITARRSDGATARLQTMTRQHSGPMDRMITYSDGTRVRTVDGLSVKVTWRPLPGKRLDALRESLIHPPQNCSDGQGESVAGYSEISGQSVAIIDLAPRPSGFNPEDKLIFRNFFAPGLACELLGYSIHEESHLDGSRKLMTESKLVSLTIAEPDSTYFEVSPALAEARPSEFMQRVYKMLGAPVTDKETSEWQQADDEYSEGR